MHANDPNYAARAHEQLVQFYLAEMREMDRISRAPGFSQILQHLQAYPKYLRSRRKLSSAIRPLVEASGGTRIISVAKLTPQLAEYVHTAHMAACCVLNQDRQYSLRQLQSGMLMQLAEQFINSPAAQNPSVSRMLMQRINMMDAVRTIQLLRVSGLVTRQSSAMKQLALGAAGGVKDIFYIHTLPSIAISKVNGDDQISFDSTGQRAADIIVSDADPRFKQAYNEYAADESLSIRGYINDTMTLLDELADTGIEKRNLVTMLRIEPAMITSTAELLQKLTPLVDDNCDFIFSIGAGDNIDAYQQRIDITAQLFNDLNTAGLTPVLFQMHHGGSALEQGQSLQYGSMATSSYEILYCRLNAKALRKAFAE